MVETNYHSTNITNAAWHLYDIYKYSLLALQGKFDSILLMYDDNFDVIKITGGFTLLFKDVDGEETRGQIQVGATANFSVLSDVSVEDLSSSANIIFSQSKEYLVDAIVSEIGRIGVLGGLAQPLHLDRNLLLEELSDKELQANTDDKVEIFRGTKI